MTATYRYYTWRGVTYEIPSPAMEYHLIHFIKSHSNRDDIAYTTTTLNKAFHIEQYSVGKFVPDLRSLNSVAAFFSDEYKKNEAQSTTIPD